MRSTSRALRALLMAVAGAAFALLALARVPAPVRLAAASPDDRYCASVVGPSTPAWIVESLARRGGDVTVPVALRVVDRRTSTIANLAAGRSGSPLGDDELHPQALLWGDDSRHILYAWTEGEIGALMRVRGFAVGSSAGPVAEVPLGRWAVTAVLKQLTCSDAKRREVGMRIAADGLPFLAAWCPRLERDLAPRDWVLAREGWIDDLVANPYLVPKSERTLWKESQGSSPDRDPEVRLAWTPSYLYLCVSIGDSEPGDPRPREKPERGDGLWLSLGSAPNDASPAIYQITGRGAAARLAGPNTGRNPEQLQARAPWFRASQMAVRRGAEGPPAWETVYALVLRWAEAGMPVSPKSGDALPFALTVQHTVAGRSAKWSWFSDLSRKPVQGSPGQLVLFDNR